MTKTKQVTIYLPEPVAEALEREAQENYTTLPKQVVRVLVDYSKPAYISEETITIEAIKEQND